MRDSKVWRELVEASKRVEVLLIKPWKRQNKIAGKRGRRMWHVADPSTELREWKLQ
jgi:hypothetical protein